MLGSDEMLVDVIAELFAILNETEVAFFLVNIDDIGISLTLVTQNEVFQNIAFSYSSLPRKDDDRFFSKPRVNLVGIIFSADYFHCL